MVFCELLSGGNAASSVADLSGLRFTDRFMVGGRKFMIWYIVARGLERFTFSQTLSAVG